MSQVARVVLFVEFFCQPPLTFYTTIFNPLKSFSFGVGNYSRIVRVPRNGSRAVFGTIDYGNRSNVTTGLGRAEMNALRKIDTDYFGAVVTVHEALIVVCHRRCRRV